MKILETTLLVPGTTVRILESPGSGRAHLRGKTARVVAPYSGCPADQTPVAGVCGHGFGDNLYPGDIVDVVQ